MNTNLLDLNNDVLNIIGRYVKQDNFGRQLDKEEQVLNGKEINFPSCSWYLHLHEVYLDHKKYMNRIDGHELKRGFMKRYFFEYIDLEMITMRQYMKTFKYKLSDADLRMCVWVFFQRLKFMLEDDFEYNLNIEDENNYLDEYFKLNKINLKSKKYSFNY